MKLDTITKIIEHAHRNRQPRGSRIGDSRCEVHTTVDHNDAYIITAAKISPSDSVLRVESERLAGQAVKSAQMHGDSALVSLVVAALDRLYARLFPVPHIVLSDLEIDGLLRTHGALRLCFKLDHLTKKQAAHVAEKALAALSMWPSKAAA